MCRNHAPKSNPPHRPRGRHRALVRPRLGARAADHDFRRALPAGPDRTRARPGPAAGLRQGQRCAGHPDPRCDRLAEPDPLRDRALRRQARCRRPERGGRAAGAAARTAGAARGQGNADPDHRPARPANSMPTATAASSAPPMCRASARSRWNGPCGRPPPAIASPTSPPSASACDNFSAAGSPAWSPRRVATPRPFSMARLAHRRDDKRRKLC